MTDQEIMERIEDITERWDEAEWRIDMLRVLGDQAAESGNPLGYLILAYSQITPIHPQDARLVRQGIEVARAVKYFTFVSSDQRRVIVADRANPVNNVQCSAWVFGGPGPKFSYAFDGLWWWRHESMSKRNKTWWGRRYWPIPANGVLSSVRLAMFWRIASRSVSNRLHSIAFQG